MVTASRTTSAGSVGARAISSFPAWAKSWSVFSVARMLSTWASPSVKVSRSSGEAACWESWYSASRRLATMLRRSWVTPEASRPTVPIRSRWRSACCCRFTSSKEARSISPRSERRETSRSMMRRCETWSEACWMASRMSAGSQGLRRNRKALGPVDGRLERVHVGVSGQDDAGHVGAAPAQLLEQVDAGHARHALVGDHDVERHLLGDGERLVAGGGRVDLPALLVLEEPPQDEQVVAARRRRAGRRASAGCPCRSAPPARRSPGRSATALLYPPGPTL